MENETVSGNDVFPEPVAELVEEPVAEPVAETVIQTIEVIDYTEQLNMLNNNVNYGFMFTIFFIGVLSGVLIGKILWERVHI